MGLLWPLPSRCVKLFVIVVFSVSVCVEIGIPRVTRSRKSHGNFRKSDDTKDSGLTLQQTSFSVYQQPFTPKVVSSVLVVVRPPWDSGRCPDEATQAADVR